MARFNDDSQVLASLAERVALNEIRTALPGARVVEVRGWMNEDWIRVLRVRRVRDADGTLLFDAEAGAEADLEDTLHEIGTEYLDLLLDLSGDTYMGAHDLTIE